VLTARSLDEALTLARELETHRYQAFTLVLVRGTTVALCHSNGSALAVDVWPLTRPFLATSSSLGDQLVTPPRRALFERCFHGEDAGAWLAAQARYHRHRWATRPAISVRMSREDAATVSCSVINIGRGRATIRYRPFTGDRPTARAVALPMVPPETASEAAS
jgi:hypothetical protein